MYKVAQGLFKKKSRTLMILIALFVVFLWATSWVLIKIGLRDIPALTFAGLRYSLAFIFLLPMVFPKKRRLSFRSISKRSWLRLIILGIIFYAVTQGASFVALSYLPAVMVNLLESSDLDDGEVRELRELLKRKSEEGGG